MSEADIKWCPECQELRLRTDFFRDRRRSDGLTSYCKPCQTRRNAESKARRARGERIETRRAPRRLTVERTTKRCPACYETKDLDEFVVNTSKRDGVGGYCLPCHSEIVRENVTSNHGSTRSAHLKRRYGLTAADVDALVEAQGGMCAICETRPAEHVDHDHATGAVRGILCFTCNVGLGNFGDERARLRAAAAYLDGFVPPDPAVLARLAFITGRVA